MNEIRILDKLTSQSIAAGEVVEGPSSVVKELLENSLDAGASRISVFIKNGGKNSIKVIDNGKGMSAEDVELAFKDHATSKIIEIQDLDYLSTLGFRGEALPTIAAVSKVKIETRREIDEVGTELIIEGGNIISKRSVHCKQGTNIEVKDLFYNTPARFKFLKTDQGEAGKITEVIQELALGNPGISFYFDNSGKEVLHTPGDNKVLSVIYAVFGAQMAKGMTEILDGKPSDSVKISGYIGLPEISRKSRRWEYFFVNGRCIKSPILTKATEDAYKSTLMTQKYPACVINLQIPGNLIDVNVHPRKLEVRFWNDSEIYRAVYHTVQNSLFTALRPATIGLDDEDANLFNKADESSSSEVKETDKQDNDFTFNSSENNENQSISTKEVKKNIFSETDNSNRIYFDFAGLGRPNSNNRNRSEENKHVGTDTDELNLSISESLKKYENIKNTSEAYTESQHDKSDKALEQIDFDDNNGLSDDEIRRKELKQARFAGELFKTYLLFEINGKVIVIDQHAAHEKILFEKNLKDYAQNHRINTQYLLEPVHVKLNPQEEIFIQENPDFFNQYGFELDIFGPAEILIRAIPIGPEMVDPEKSLRYLLDDVLENGIDQVNGDRELIYHIIATASCKAAVKAHDVLDPREVEELRSLLLGLDNPYHCPHGRPIVLEISKYELEKLFKRVV